jgi:hypothetical protein
LHVGPISGHRLPDIVSAWDYAWHLFGNADQDEAGLEADLPPG